ncbi:DUF3971 domain-containing protein [Candidatus Halocynthiibacter alkanivorans]|uniref:DUF3971 domain-containing protein n=1 Tax=Candidatus Halocynthiibacter alkanivorans TaxID=2267619 RepID=UPI0013576F78|nr:DUF3971 domain-containing protein [Candidatus Halocynthiibacter alkanivorans]
MTQTPETNQQKSPEPRRRTGLWLALAAALLVLLLGGAFLSLGGRSLQVPGWALRQVEARLNQDLPTGRVSLNRMIVEIGRDFVPRVSFRDVALFDDRGAEVAVLNDISAVFAPHELLRGRVLPENLRLSGAQMIFRRRADGQFDLSFGADAGTSGTLAGMLGAVDRAFSVAPLSDVSRIEASDLTISLEDARSGRIWQVTGGRLTLSHVDDEIDVNVQFDVFNGTEELANMSVRFRSRKGSPEARISARFDNAAAADIALQSPVLTFLQVLNAPISGELQAQIGADGVLSGLRGRLDAGAGALQPTEQTKPVPFTAAASAFSFDAVQQKLSFSELSVQSSVLNVTGSGQAYLQDFNAGWPAAMLGQFSISSLDVNPDGVFEAPVHISEGAMDFRLRLDPFTLDLGQLMLKEGEERLLVNGQVRAEDTGWSVAADLSMDTIRTDRIIELWPLTAAGKTRKWLLENVLGGQVSDFKGAIRVRPGQDTVASLGWRYEQGNVRFMKSLPPVTNASGYASLEGKRYFQMIESGQVRPAEGGVIEVGGTALSIPDITVRPATLDITLNASSPVTAALSLMNEPPFRVLRRTPFSVDLAQGQATATGTISVPLRKKPPKDQIKYEVSALLEQVETDQIMPGRVLRSDQLELHVNPGEISISGPATVGAVPLTGRWVLPRGGDSDGSSSIEAQVTLSQAALDEFNIALPKGSVRGTGTGALMVALGGGVPPRFTLSSDLNRLSLSLPQVGWSKSRNQTGKLWVKGEASTPPRISELSLEAPGLSAQGGVVKLTEEGRLDVLSFARVRLGGWLDAPLRLVGRGKNAAPAIEVTGGRLDLRNMPDTSGPGGGASAGSGPISLNLNQLTVSEGIRLEPFRGTFKTQGGFQGDFTARVNGDTPIVGALAPSALGPVIRVRGSDAGGALRDAGLLEQGRGGDLELILTPRKGKGVYDGRLTVRNTRVVGAPALAELLSAISIVGLLEQLGGPGIVFTTVEASFRLDPRRLTLLKSSAIGPSLGISLDGIFDLATKQIDMQGVVSPVYFLNGIGALFTRRGEGLFGFNFNLRGPSASPSVRVNPLSILTPAMFREIFRRPPPELPADGQ